MGGKLNQNDRPGRTSPHLPPALYHEYKEKPFKLPRH